MKKRLFFGLHVLGWGMVMLVLLMGAVYSVAADDELYFRLQMAADILPSAGISGDDLQILDERLAGYLLSPMRADVAFDNREMQVFGRFQPPFSERELEHLCDCRRLLSITDPTPAKAALLLLGLLMLCMGGRKGARSGKIEACLAAVLILAPLAAFGLWAALDFDAAFAFFHRCLFTNDLWLLNPRTDLLIRICPAGMFAGMGLRIALRAALPILGLPLLVYLLFRVEKWLNKRKKEQKKERKKERKKQNEWAEI